MLRSTPRRPAGRRTHMPEQRAKPTTGSARFGGNRRRDGEGVVDRRAARADGRARECIAFERERPTRIAPTERRYAEIACSREMEFVLRGGLSPPMRRE
ncbi:MAG: hypothetical protein KJZ54_05585 [Phycisphaerales bacterium]|nr:hypothetical protein [Phycisphaerales bacterium]